MGIIKQQIESTAAAVEKAVTKDIQNIFREIRKISKMSDVHWSRSNAKTQFALDIMQNKLIDLGMDGYEKSVAEYLLRYIRNKFEPENYSMISIERMNPELQTLNKAQKEQLTQMKELIDRVFKEKDFKRAIKNYNKYNKKSNINAIALTTSTILVMLCAVSTTLFSTFSATPDFKNGKAIGKLMNPKIGIPLAVISGIAFVVSAIVVGISMFQLDDNVSQRDKLEFQAQLKSIVAGFSNELAAGAHTKQIAGLIPDQVYKACNIVKADDDKDNIRAIRKYVKKFAETTYDKDLSKAISEIAKATFKNNPEEQKTLKKTLKDACDLGTVIKFKKALQKENVAFVNM